MTELTNLEICKKIAEIEGFTIPECGHTNDGVWCSFMPNNCYGHYNPLTDDALCFQLIIKHKIDLIFNEFGTVSAYYSKKYAVTDTNTNKAALLAIIEAHNE